MEIEQVNDHYDDAPAVAERFFELTPCLQGCHLLHIAIVVVPQLVAALAQKSAGGSNFGAIGLADTFLVGRALWHIAPA